MARPKTFGVAQPKNIYNKILSDKPISIQTSDNLSIFTQNIDMYGIVAGYYHKLDIWNKINDIMPNTSNRTNLSAGSWTQIFIQKLLSPLAPAGLHSLDLLPNAIPIQLLTPDDGAEAKMINRNAAARFLDRIDDYGATKFFVEFSKCLIDPQSADAVTSLHGDSTSTRYTGVSTQEAIDSAKPFDEICIDDSFWFESQLLRMVQGYSRDNAPHLPQACHFAFTTKTHLTPITQAVYFVTYSGNINDKTSFAKITNEDLEKIKNRFKNLKYIIFDNAGSSIECAYNITSLRLDLITRLSDNLKEVKKARKAVLNNDDNIQFQSYTTKNTDGDEYIVEIAKLSEFTLTETKAQVKKRNGDNQRSITYYPILCKAESLRDTKTNTINKHANNQLLSAQSKISQISCACEKDALAAYKKIKISHPLCSFDNLIIMEQETKNNSKKQDTDKEYTVICKVCVNDNAVNQAIEDELLYVLATTDPNATPIQIYEEYHGQVHVESFWKEMKERGEFMDAIFLKNPKRIRAMYALIACSINFAHYICSHIHKIMKQHNLQLIISGNSYTKPIWSTLKQQFTQINHISLFIMDNENASILWNANGVLSYIISEMPQEVQSFYTPETYLANNGIERLFEIKKYYIDKYQKVIKQNSKQNNLKIDDIEKKQSSPNDDGGAI